MIDCAGRVLGRGVRQRPDKAARGRQGQGPRLPRNTEVQHASGVVGAQHDVVGFDIAMDDPAGVRFLQGPRHLGRDA